MGAAADVLTGNSTVGAITNNLVIMNTHIIIHTHAYSVQMFLKLRI